MKLECTNSNGEILLGRKLNHVELCFLKNCKNCIQKWILQVIFSKRCSYCPKNKVVYNFLIISPNGMNQRFPCRPKKIIYEWKKFQKKNPNFETLFYNLFSLVLNLFGHNFCSRASIEKKLYFLEDNQFSIFKKSYEKSQQKFSS